MIALLTLRPYASEADVVVPSPNHGERKAPAIEGIVLHATADEGNEAGTLTWIVSPKSGVSCHLLVSRDGRVTRFVGDQQRAWHAGKSWWRGTSDVNSITLGIEIANRNDGEPYTDEQYCRVAEIVAHYCRQGLTLDDVVAHSDIAAERRTDPLGWDWNRLQCMVQEQLRPAEVALPAAYDRRSSERMAAENAVEVPATVVNTETPAAPRTTGSYVTPPPEEIAAAPARRISPASMQAPRPSRPVLKPMRCSRTLWANALTMLAAGSVIISESLDLATSVGLTVSERLTMWALFAAGFVNILLRLDTSCPVRPKVTDQRKRSI
jgi:N-acetyl-anhydromuramyl-L-alanine amidase AmpD